MERVIRALTGHVEGSEAILTYPMRDLVGDYVKPDGGRWESKTPVANWTHFCPIGRGNLSLKSISHEGESHNVWTSVTDFFEHEDQLKGVDLTKFADPVRRKPIGQYSKADVLTVAKQAKQLVKADIATGVSIEFVPDGKKGEAYWDLEGPLTDGRPPRHFEKWLGFTYAHARSPINPGARTVKALVDGRFDGQELHPEIMRCFKATTGHPASIRALEASKRALAKSGRGYFAKGNTRELNRLLEGANRHGSTLYSTEAEHHAAARDHMALADFHAEHMSHTHEDAHVKAWKSNMRARDAHNDAASTTVKSLETSFEGPLMYQQMVGQNEPAAGARCVLNFAQYILDGCVGLERDVQQSDSPEFRMKVRQLCEATRAIAADANDFVIRRKNALDGIVPDPAEAEAKAELELADGLLVCKAYPDWKPRRFKAEELKPPIEDSAELKSVLETLELRKKELQQLMAIPGRT